MGSESARRSKRSRSRSRERERSYRDTSRDRDGYRRRDRDRERRRDRYDSSSRERSSRHKGTTFASAGKLFQDNGGLPGLQQDADQNRWQLADEQDARQQRQQDYASQLEGGLDDSSEEGAWRDSGDDRSQDHRGSHRSDRHPSTTLYVRGIPGGKDESDLHQLFGKWHGIVSIRVARDRLTGQPRGFAFVEFENTDAAQAVMDAEGRYIDLDDGDSISLEYSHTQQHTSVSQTGTGLDWVCNMCQSINFARRLECHQCSTARPPDAQRVSTDIEAPSNVLKVSNVEPQTTEEALYYHVSPHASVTEVRLVMDRQRGMPRGFGFVQFQSIADASRVLHALQDSKIEGQAKRLRFCFARDRHADKSQLSDAAANALEAAQSMAAYTGWAPKEFDESALKGAAPEQSGTTAATGTSAERQAENGNKNQQQPGQAMIQPGNADSGFEYDSASGYYFHAASGFYYDANTGLYFDSSDQQWKSHDPQTGQYLPVDSQQQAGGSGPEGTAATTTAAGQGAAQLLAPEVDYKPPPEAKKRGAIIGSAPKLNPEGILAAAREAQAKAEQQQRAEAAAAKKAAQKAQRQQKQSSVQPGAAPHPVAATPPLGATGPVKGVIRSSGKWRGAKN